VGLSFNPDEFNKLLRRIVSHALVKTDKALIGLGREVEKSSNR